jgi:hypothetical protein
MISPTTTTGGNSKQGTSSSNIQGAADFIDQAGTVTVISDDVHERKRPSLTSDTMFPTKVPKTQLSFRTPDVDYTGPGKATATLKIQSFVRGSMCRARVSEMVATLIEQLIQEQEETAMSMHGHEFIREEGYTDSSDRKDRGNSDGDTDEEIIDGLHFPSSLPSDLLEAGNNSCTSLGFDDSFAGSTHRIRSMSPTKSPFNIKPTWGGRAKEASSTGASTTEGKSSVNYEAMKLVQPVSVRDRVGTFDLRGTDGSLPTQPKNFIIKKGDPSSDVDKDEKAMALNAAQNNATRHSSPWKQNYASETSSSGRDESIQPSVHDQEKNVLQNPESGSTKDHDGGDHSLNSLQGKIIGQGSKDDLLSVDKGVGASGAPIHTRGILPNVDNEKGLSVRDIVWKSEDRSKHQSSSYHGLDSTSRSRISDIDSRNGSQHSFASSASEPVAIAIECPPKGRKPSSIIRDKMNSFGPSSPPAETQPMGDKKSKLSDVPQSMKKKGYWITPDKKPMEEPKVPERTEKALEIPPIFGAIQAKKKKKKGSTKSSSKSNTMIEESETGNKKLDDTPSFVSPLQKKRPKEDVAADEHEGIANILSSSAASEMEVEETPMASIAARKLQLGICEQSDEGNNSTQTITGTPMHDEEVKRFDVAARRYVMESAATRIQALARGYFFRRKDKEATLVVVNWLKQYRRLDVEMDDTVAVSEETRLLTVNALAAEIEELEPTEHSSMRKGEELYEENSFFTGEQPILSLSERKKAFQERSESKLEAPGAEAPLAWSQHASTRLKETRARQNEAATKVQSIFRGSKVRSVDYKAMQQAMRFLKDYKLALSRDLDGDTDLEIIAISDITSKKARSTLAALKSKLDNTAIKIQAICRGFIARKFDLHAMVIAISWIKEQQYAFSLANSSYEPDEAALETAWIFLEENKTWTKDRTLKPVAASPRSEVVDNSTDHQTTPESAIVDVTDLLNTWEWLVKNESKSTMLGQQPNASSDDEPQENKIPDLDKLATLQDWVEENQASLRKERSQTPSEARLYNNEIVPDGDEGEGKSSSPSLREGYSVAAGGNGTMRSRGRFAFTDDSFGGEDTKSQLGKEIRCYSDNSISSGGHKDIAQNTPRVYRDSSISGGVKSDQGGNNDAEVGEQVNISEMLNLWRWLESNQMNMKVFEKRTTDDGKNKNLEDVHSDRSPEKETLGLHRRHDNNRGKGDSVEYFDDISDTISTQMKDHIDNPCVTPEHENLAEKVVDNFLSVGDVKQSRDVAFQLPNGDMGEGEGDTDANADADADATSSGKPSMKSMLTYWHVSSHYAPATVGLENKVKTDNLVNMVPNTPYHPASGSKIPLEPTEKETIKDWRGSPANNELLGTLAWLKNQGLKLDSLGKPDTISYDSVMHNQKEFQAELFDEAISTSTNTNGLLNNTVSSVPTKTDMAETLQWLQANGYQPRSRSGKANISEKVTATLESQPAESESGSIEKSRPEPVPDILKRETPPSASEIAKSLKWLDKKRALKSCEDEVEHDDVHSTSEAGTEPDNKMNSDFDNILFSLSWLKSNGFALGKDSTSGHGRDAEVDDLGCPTLQEVESAIESIDGISFETTKQSEFKNEGTTSVENDMKRTLEWLSKRGMRLPSSATSRNTSNESPDAVTAESVVAKEALADDPEVDWAISKPRSASSLDGAVSDGEAKLGRRTPETNKTQEMSTALQWLQSRGIKLEKRSSVNKSIKSPKMSDPPSVKEAESAIDSLSNVTKGNERKSIEPGEESNRGVPSAKEVEQAVSWLKLRESARRMATKADVESTKPERTTRTKPSDSVVPRKDQPIYDGKQVDYGLKESVNETDHQRNSQAISGSRDRTGTHSRSSDKPRKNGAAAAKPTKNEMEKALSFLQHQVTNRNANRNPVNNAGKELHIKPKATPKTMQSTELATSQRVEPPRKEKRKTQEERDYTNALKWLSNQEVDAPEDIPYFKKLDSMLPIKRSQTKESRAQEIAKALKWVKKQGIVLSGKRQVANPTSDSTTTPGPPAIGGQAKPDKGSATKDSKFNKQAGDKDYQNCMKWLTTKDRESVEDANYFNKLDSMLPIVPGQTNDERARDMVRALKWVKKTSARKGALQATLSGTARSVLETAQVPATTRIDSKGKPSSIDGKGTDRSSRAKEGILQTTMNKQMQSQAVAPPRYPEPRKSLPEMMRQQKELKEAVAMSRSSGTKMQPQRTTHEASSPKMSQGKKVPALTETKNAKAGGSSPNKSSTKKPKSKQDEKKATPKLTRRESFADKTTKETTVSTTGPDDYFDATVANALRWLKNEDRDELDDAATLKKIDSMLPKRAGQTPQQRAMEMARAMMLLQKRGGPSIRRTQSLVPTSSSAPSSSPRPSIDIKGQQTETSAEIITKPPERTTEQDRVEALAYLRAKAMGQDTSSHPAAAQFRRLDNMMPSNKDQTDEKRAEDMVKMMAWLRKIGKAK